MRTSIPFLFCCALLAGCAPNFEQKPLPANHPASVQAEEAPRSHIKQLITTDELTRTTYSQLARKEAPTPDNGRPNGMGSMEGMDHSQMKTMPPAAAATTPPASTIYTCVMHPEVQQSMPGKCPKCGMTLVKKKIAAP